MKAESKRLTRDLFGELRIGESLPRTVDRVVQMVRERLVHLLTVDRGDPVCTYESPLSGDDRLLSWFSHRSLVWHSPDRTQNALAVALQQLNTISVHHEKRADLFLTADAVEEEAYATTVAAAAASE